MEKELQAYISQFVNEIENKYKKMNFLWFFKCKFEKFIMAESTMCLHIKVAELNPLSDGNIITGITSAVFLMRHYKFKQFFFFFLINWVTGSPSIFLHTVGSMVPDIHAKFHNQQFIMRRAIKPFLTLFVQPHAQK